jgi:bis(5'-nucleosyl)-tetraphosphatase (symmetrical)
LRCVINALTRLRYCTADGVMKLKLKQAPDDSQTSAMPWFSVPHRASRGTTVVFGHWSTLGFHTGDGVVALDTGCVWGGSLSAWSFDKRRVVSEPCRGYQPVGGD